MDCDFITVFSNARWRPLRLRRNRTLYLEMSSTYLELQRGCPQEIELQLLAQSSTVPSSQWGTEYRTLCIRLNAVWKTIVPPSLQDGNWTDVNQSWRNHVNIRSLKCRILSQRGQLAGFSQALSTGKRTVGWASPIKSVEASGSLSLVPLSFGFIWATLFWFPALQVIFDYYLTSSTELPTEMDLLPGLSVFHCI